MKTSTMRIGVIADTHDHLPQAALQALHGVDELWHLGDVTADSVIDSLRVLGVPIYVVRGNCDFNTDYPLVMNLERNGVNFCLQHIPPSDLFSMDGAHILLHGHTHVPRDETIRGIRYLNPGTAGRPNKGAPPSFAFLTITPQGEITWDLQKI